MEFEPNWSEPQSVRNRICAIFVLTYLPREQQYKLQAFQFKSQFGIAILFEYIWGVIEIVYNDIGFVALLYLLALQQVPIINVAIVRVCFKLFFFCWLVEQFYQKYTDNYVHVYGIHLYTVNLIKNLIIVIVIWNALRSMVGTYKKLCIIQ